LPTHKYFHSNSNKNAPKVLKPKPIADRHKHQKNHLKNSNEPKNSFPNSKEKVHSNSEQVLHMLQGKSSDKAPTSILFRPQQGKPGKRA
jgi:hypothetical protein